MIYTRIRRPQPGSIPPRATNYTKPSLAVTGGFLHLKQAIRTLKNIG